MPSTIRDLTELTAVAVDDYFVVSDTSDVTNRDKRISQANLLGAAVLRSGTPTAGNVASWLNGTTAQDSGVAVSNLALRSAANTFTAIQTIAPTANNTNGLVINMPTTAVSPYVLVAQYNGVDYLRLAARSTVSAFVMAAVDLGNNLAGPFFAIGNNTNATNPTPGVLSLTAKNGTQYFLWVDTAAKLRISATSPTSTDTGGTVVGTQT